MLGLTADLGLLISTIGAIVVLLPGIPWGVRATLTGWGDVAALDVARSDFSLTDSTHGPFHSDNVAWFDPVARIVKRRVGIRPDQIAWTPADPPQNTQLAFQIRNQNTSYAVDEPSLIHDWIIREQEALRVQRTGYYLTVGGLLIGAGFVIQFVA